MASALQSWLVGTLHSTSFSFNNCDYQPQSYTNKGSARLKFDDLCITTGRPVAHYQGFLQRPNQDEPVYQELEHELDDPTTPGSMSISSLSFT